MQDMAEFTEADFYDLGMAYYSTVARENLVYAEIFFDPQAHTTRGVEFSTVIEGLRRAGGRAVDAQRLRHELDDRRPQAGLPRRARRLPRSLSRSVERLAATSDNPPGRSPQGDGER